MPPASPEHFRVLRRLTTALESSCYSYVPRSQMKTTLLPTRYTRRNSLCRDLCINAIWLVIPAISRIARSLNRKDRGRQQTYECTYNNQSELHHDLSRVWGLIPREWNTAVDVYRYRRPYPISGSNREHTPMQRSTRDESRTLQSA